jgi:hypothetical protein
VTQNRELAETDPKAFAAKFGERVTEAIAREVDRIEKELKTRIPELHFLDFEGDATATA